MRKKKFSYKDIKNVYTIVLFENSPKVFQQFPQKYFHMFEQKSDTGLELNLLQKYIFIPLDIFKCFAAALIAKPVQISLSNARRAR